MNVPSLRKRLRTSRVLFNEISADDDDRFNFSRRAPTSSTQPAELVDHDRRPPAPSTVARLRAALPQLAARGSATAGRRRTACTRVSREASQGAF